MSAETAISPIFGRLTWEALPFHEPILVVTFAVVVLGDEDVRVLILFVADPKIYHPKAVAEAAPAKPMSRGEFLASVTGRKGSRA